VKPVLLDPKVSAAATGDVRHGRRGGRPDVRLLGGYFIFDSPDAPLLVSLLPAILHVRGVERLTALVRLVGEESRERRPGRDLVLARLIELLLIESLRSKPDNDTPPGLLRGLADARLAAAIRHIHGDPARSWTVEQLARKVALSRSAFFDRFSRAVGLPRWNISSRGAWLSPRICYVAATLDWLRLPSGWAMAQPVPSAPRSAGTSVSRRAATARERHLAAG
jgi:AraC-like DNA-binding protein